MNHSLIYESIICKAQISNRMKLNKTDSLYVYYETHHILPKCLGGTDDVSNLVLLTAREHYVCHKLLTHIHKGNRKLTCALHRMTFNTKYGVKNSSRDYAYAIEIFKTTPISEETRNKMSLSHSNESEETRLKKSVSAKGHSNGKGYKHTEDAKQRMREKISGSLHPNFGKRHSIETIEKNRKTNIATQLRKRMERNEQT